MKISESWLREWIGSEPSTKALCERLDMSGLEIEGLTPVAGEFSGLIVASVLTVDAHPQADRLSVCTVDAGGPEPLNIVCGATNVVAGMKAVLATVGAVLPNGMVIKASRLRGVMSEGMLCSASELGLGEEGVHGLMVLAEDAPIGRDVREYLALNDKIIDISITPNRGDCLSILGLSREISALTGNSLQLPETYPDVAPHDETVFPVIIDQPSACPRYVGRVIRHLRPLAVTPLWMQERLRRSGIRCISPVVDVSNYVMLELGQPMHAFDLAKLSGGIQVRQARKDETLALLDGRTVSLDTQTLVIADSHGPLAIAGVMGGMASGVTPETDTLFLESAFFNPGVIAYAVRTYQTGSESSYRFERGVDPELQKLALERATALILEIAGGQAGPVMDVKNPAHLPAPVSIFLRHKRLNQMAGVDFTRESVSALLRRPLGFIIQETAEGWEVRSPARRFDITREVDLIEEILRLHGYENIPTITPKAGYDVIAGLAPSVTSLSRLLCDRGYHEIITYSFVDQKLQALFVPDSEDIELVNPITSDMSVMRKTLWPGLVSALQYNLNRQQSRIRLFETGKRFIRHEGSLLEQPVISGLVTGAVTPLQWGEPEKPADFFDLKGDVDYFLAMTGRAGDYSAKPGCHPALHPGQTMDIFCSGEYAGTLGALHPGILQALDLPQTVLVFELLTDGLMTPHTPLAAAVSRFPLIRRDMAIVLDSAVPAKAIRDTINNLGDGLLQSVTIFDVYQGKGIIPGKKSMALALVIQHPERTLKDEEVAALIQRIFNGLKEGFAAELRG